VLLKENSQSFGCLFVLCMLNGECILSWISMSAPGIGDDSRVEFPSIFLAALWCKQSFMGPKSTDRE
jgi:hypothetical protein